MIVRSHLNFPVHCLCVIFRVVRIPCFSSSSYNIKNMVFFFFKSKWLRTHTHTLQTMCTNTPQYCCLSYSYSKHGTHRWHNRHALEPILPLKWGGTCIFYTLVSPLRPIYRWLSIICTFECAVKEPILATVWPHFIFNILDTYPAKGKATPTISALSES